MWKFLKKNTSKFLVQPDRSVLRPMVLEFGAFTPWTTKTSFGVTHVAVSGLRKPVAHATGDPVVGTITARVLCGAFGLPMSGRSPVATPSRFRSTPLTIVNGAPDWKVVTPESCHPPMIAPIKPFVVPGMFQM